MHCPPTVPSSPTWQFENRKRYTFLIYKFSMLKLKMARSEKAYSFTVKQDLNWCWGNDQAIKAMDAKKNERNINYTCIYNTIFFHTKYTYRTCLKKKLQKYWNFKQQTINFLKYYTFCKTSYTSNMVIDKTRNDLSFLT